MNLPEKYTESMKALLGDEYDSYIESFSDKRLYGLRVNNLKISTEDFLKICPFKLEPIPWIENGFYYSEDDKPAKHPYYFAGLYYIQEPSAMTPANVLPEQAKIAEAAGACAVMALERIPADIRIIRTSGRFLKCFIFLKRILR